MKINSLVPPGPGPTYDREIAESSSCLKCGGDCEFVSHYEKHDDGTYVYQAFVVCKKCKIYEEF